MKGVIIKSLSGEYDVYLESNDIITCKPLGLFRHKNIRPKVGDNVIVNGFAVAFNGFICVYIRERIK